MNEENALSEELTLSEVESIDENWKMLGWSSDLDIFS